MKTTTELRIDYVFLSWNYDFPPKIETALENDYVASPHLYDEDALKQVATLLLIEPDASAQCVMGTVRNFRSDSQVTAKQRA
jgi:hypothetical protein